MADIASLADVYVAPGQFERRIGAHAVNVLDRVLEIEEGRDLDDPADRDDEKREDEEEGGASLQDAVLAEGGHVRLPIPPGRRQVRARVRRP